MPTTLKMLPTIRRRSLQPTKMLLLQGIRKQPAMRRQPAPQIPGTQLQQKVPLQRRRMTQRMGIPKLLVTQKSQAMMQQSQQMKPMRTHRRTQLNRQTMLKLKTARKPPRKLKTRQSQSNVFLKFSSDSESPDLTVVAVSATRLLQGLFGLKDGHLLCFHRLSFRRQNCVLDERDCVARLVKRDLVHDGFDQSHASATAACNR